MCARNLMLAVIVAITGAMFYSCVGSDSAHVESTYTQLPLEMSDRQAATQEVVTAIATKLNMVAEDVKVNLIASY